MEKESSKIAVVGAGVMGHGIAQAFAMGGYKVSLFSRTQQTLDRGFALIKSSLDIMVEAGVVDNDQVQAILGRITLTRSLEEGAQEADIAIETVAEDREAKKEIFAQLDKYCPPRALLASNTSFLNIFDFVETSRPDKVLITHWYTPPQLIPLVDVVGGPRIDKANLEFITQTLKKIGKKPMVLKKFIAGYAINRLQHAMTREVHYLLDNGYVTPEQLDEGAINCIALRMLVLGIARRYDFNGLKMKIINPPQYEDAPLDYKPKKLAELVEQGNLGVKTGRGFYDYEGKSEIQLCRERDIRLIQTLTLLNGLEARGSIGKPS